MKLTLIIQILGLTILLSCSSARNSTVPEKDELPFSCQKQPIPKLRQLAFMLDVYELINDSTLSEKPVLATTIYQDKDTLEISNYIINGTNWEKVKSCEGGFILTLPGIYYFKTAINSNGQFSELTLIRGTSPECTESIRKAIQNALDSIVVLGEQYFNKNVCLRLEAKCY